LVLLALGTWLNERIENVPIFDVLLTLVLLSSIVRLSLSRRQARIGWLLGIPTIAALWLREIVPDTRLSAVALALLTVFLLYTTATILIHVLGAEEVTIGTLSEAFSVFLLLGFAW